MKNRAVPKPNTHRGLPNLRCLREQSGYTLHVLADETGIDSAELSRMERGATDPRLSTVRRLAGALEVSMDALTVNAHLKPYES